MGNLTKCNMGKHVWTSMHGISDGAVDHRKDTCVCGQYTLEDMAVSLACEWRELEENREQGDKSNKDCLGGDK